MRAHRTVALVLGVVTLISTAVLLAWDIHPGLFPAGAHNVLGAVPLATIALAYLVYESTPRPTTGKFAKAFLLACAFLFWAANQLWPDSPVATLFNDLAIGLFVLDVFWIMVASPSGDAMS
jgi:hypothetical protein